MLSSLLHRYGHLLPMSTALLLCIFLARADSQAIVPLFLGVIAASLAELDYSGRQGLRFWRGVLLGFFTISWLMTWALADFWVFAVLFTALTFLATALAALGLHYKSLAFGILVMALYNALNHQEALPWWYNPYYLTCGALSYALAAMTWQALAPQRPVQSALAQVYAALADFLQQKALFFQPDYHTRLPQYQSALQSQHLQVIEALNDCRHVLFRHAPQRLLLRTQQYFTAQDIHERLSSSHIDYAAMAKRFAHQDILFRFQYLIATQAEECRRWALAFRQGRFPCERDDLALQSQGLQSALRQQDYPEALQRIANNLLQVNQLLQNLPSREAQDPRIHAPQNHWRDSWRILRQQWQQRHATLRHAGRLTLMVALAFLGMMILRAEFPYWIVLTIIFVSQTHFSTTRNRVQQRIIGTVAGVLAAALVSLIFPSHAGKIALMAVATLCFYHFRSRQYAYSTFFMTLEALTGMALLGLNPAEALPWRLWDTLLGAALAWAGARYVFPDTHYQRPEALFQQAKRHLRDYLRILLQESRQPQPDDLTLRLARRQAQEALVACTQLLREWQSRGQNISTLQEQHQALYALSATVASLAVQIRSHTNWQQDDILQQEIHTTLASLESAS